MKNQEHRSSINNGSNQEDKCSKPMHLISVGDSLVLFARKVAEEEIRSNLSKRENSSDKRD